MSIRRLFEFLLHRRFLIQTAFVVIVTAVYIWGIHDPNMWTNPDQSNTWERTLEFSLLEMRSSLPAPPRLAPSDVVILKITPEDFKTQTVDTGIPELSYMGKDWPWNRKLWANLTERLLGSGAKLVAYDFVFNGTTEGDKEFGQVLAKNAEHVVIGSHWGTVAPGSNSILLMPEDSLIPHGEEEIMGLTAQSTDTVVRSVKNLQQAPSSLIHLLQTSNPGRDLSDIPTNSFSWLAAKKVLGAAPQRELEKIMLINFYGSLDPLDAYSAFKMVKLVDVLREWDTTFEHGAYFKGKVVFVGPDDVFRFADAFNTPPVFNMPGVELQATAFSNLVHNEWLEPAPDWIVLVLAVGLGALALVVSLWVHSVLLKMSLFATLGAIFFAATQHIFWTHLIVVPVSGAVIILVCCGAFGTLYDYILSQYERQRMLGMFESMVSPGVAGLMLSHRGDFEQRLGGQRKEVVVLFSDIRGFTSWSEQVGPDALVAQLNEYLTAMVGVIQEEGGTLQKYIGDALMAAWGDVRDLQPRDGAERAVRAALRMQKELQKLDASWRGQSNRKQLSCGIGINHGEGVVGQIGHPRRQEFTVMGDPVNLAARIESATKQYRQPVLVGESIYEMTKEIFLYRLVDKIRVLGKTSATCVYAPLGEIAGGTPPPGLPVYEAAIEKYFARNFARAAELFRTANTQMGEADFLCLNFLERCEYYSQVPPPAEWDGSWTLKEK